MSKKQTSAAKPATVVAQAAPINPTSFVVVDGFKIDAKTDAAVRSAIAGTIKNQASWRALTPTLVAIFWKLDLESDDLPESLDRDSEEAKHLYNYLLTRDPRMAEDRKPARGDFSEKATAARAGRKDAAALASMTRANILRYWEAAYATPADGEEGEQTPAAARAIKAGFNSWITRTKAELTKKIEGKNTPKDSLPMFQAMFAIIATAERIGPSATLATLDSAIKADETLSALEIPVNPAAMAEKVGAKARKPGEVKVIKGEDYKADAL